MSIFVNSIAEFINLCNVFHIVMHCMLNHVQLKFKLTEPKTRPPPPTRKPTFESSKQASASNTTTAVSGNDDDDDVDPLDAFMTGIEKEKNAAPASRMIGVIITQFFMRNYMSLLPLPLPILCLVM